ncbi:MAG: DUF2335 domain-containing protein [Opitutales bacterium]
MADELLDPRNQIDSALAKLPAFQRLKPAEKAQFSEFFVRQVSIQSTYSGALPHPEHLERFSKLIPDGAERLMGEVEKQSAHRREIEKIVITSQQNQSGRGQFLAFGIGIFGLGVAGVCIYAGHDAAGAALGGSTLVSLVWAFLKGKTEQKRDLQDKNKQPSVPATTA